MIWWSSCLTKIKNSTIIQSSPLGPHMIPIYTVNVLSLITPPIDSFHQVLDQRCWQIQCFNWTTYTMSMHFILSIHWSSSRDDEQPTYQLLEKIKFFYIWWIQTHRFWISNSRTKITKEVSTFKPSYTFSLWGTTDMNYPEHFCAWIYFFSHFDHNPSNFYAINMILYWEPINFLIIENPWT